MNKRLALELLQKVNNPSHMFSELEADEDGVSFTCFVYKSQANVMFLFQSVPNVPQRIASRLTSRPKTRNAVQANSDIHAIDEVNNTLHRPGKWY